MHWVTATLKQKKEDIENSKCTHTHCVTVMALSPEFERQSLRLVPVTSELSGVSLAWAGCLTPLAGW
jgi:hypothetical protein